MATFSPASDIWTLRYDQFGGICWQNSATQELYYIPPGQSATLPPRSLANGFRPNLPNNRPGTPASTMHPPHGFGRTVPFNNNSALRVPETAREGPASFGGCPQPHTSPSMWTEDGTQWLPPWSLANAPRQYFPNDPNFTPAAIARAEAPPLQAGGTGVQFNNNSALEVPEAGRLRSASMVEGTEPYPRPPMPRTEDATHGLPPTSSANAPLLNRPTEPHLTATAEDRHKASLLLGGRKGGKFDNSTLEVPDTARLWPESIAEGKKHHPSFLTTRVEDAKHGLSSKSLSNAPRSNISCDPPFTSTATVGAEASLLQGNGEREQFDNNSVLTVPEAMRLRPASFAEDKTPYPSTPMSRTEDAKHELSRKNLADAPPLNLPPEPHLTTSTKHRAKASLRWGGGKGRTSDNSALKVPDTARLWPESIAEDKKHHPSLPMARVEDAKHGLSRKSLSNAPRSNISCDPPFTPAATVGAEASLFQGGGEEEQFDNNSVLKVPEAMRLRPASFAEEKTPYPSTPMSRTEDAKHELSWKCLADAPPPNVPPEPHLTTSAKHRAKASLRWGGGKGTTSDNSALKVPETARLRPESIAEDKKHHPSLPMARVEDAKHRWSRKSLSNAPRPNIPQDPPVNPATTARAEASLLREGSEGGQFNNNSALEIPETAKVWTESVVGTNPLTSTPMTKAEEAKQWSRKRDNRGKEYYFNIITGESQSKKPDCLKKYSCRR